MMKLIHKFVRPVQNVEGATAVEYGIMVALIAAVIITVVGLIGQQLLVAFNAVLAGLTAA